MVIRKLGVFSVAKLYAAISLAMGLLFGLIIAAASTVGASFGGGDEPAMFGMMMGAGAVIVLPLFYGVAGFIMGAIGAALYNVFAGVVGGVRLEVE